MAPAIVSIIAGLLLLAWSAERFVNGAASLARALHASPLVIGMLVVGFGTSAPEILVSAMAAADGQTALAVGNAYGSNIFNIALVLGLTALIRPVPVESYVLRRELVVLAVVTFFALGQLLDGALSRTDGLILVTTFVVVMGWLWRVGRRNASDAAAAESKVRYSMPSMSISAATVWTVVGLAVLTASSRLLVWGAESFARELGVSELIIGLTVVAAGTSIPELASSIMAARKGELQLALGNVLGSNTFNTLAVVGIAGVIHPEALQHEVLYRDGAVMLGLTLFLFIVGYGFGQRGAINRYEGASLMAVYGIYTILLVVAVIR